jgi:glucosamine--fructose-6-phosphate aminotransferase (isomerizing)
VKGARMAADMAAQPDVLAALAERRGAVVAAVRALADPAPTGIMLVARGSSDFAAVYGRYLLEAAARRPVALAAPSLATRYGVVPELSGWLAVGLSQSGRTPEIATVLARYGAAGARTVAVTNDPDSPLGRAADLTIDLAAGPEAAVPATKTFTAQLAAMALVAEGLAPDAAGDPGWAALPGAVTAVLEDPDPAGRAAARLGEAIDVICVGRGLTMAVALEVALKLREAAGIRAEGWSAADFRHGPLTVASPDLPLVAVETTGPAREDVEELAHSLAAAGTPVVRIGDRPGADLPVPPAPAEPLAAIPAAVRGQQLALAAARRRGVDPDRPPGLAKVTATT